MLNVLVLLYPPYEVRTGGYYGLVVVTPKMHFFFYIVAHIWKTGGYLFPLLCIMYVCSVMRAYCPEIFVRLGSTYGPPGPPNYEKNVFFFHILGLHLKISYQIVSLFDMHIYMSERIAGKPDRPSPIIEDPSGPPK